MTKHDELKLPSFQPLPPEVRDRLRQRVMTELDAPRRWASRLDRARPPLAVAASVAVLAAGAMIVAQTVHDSSGGTGDTTTTTAPSATSGGATLNHPEADGELDRCWYALQQRGRAAQFPHRRTWHPVFNYTDGAVKVTAARAAGKPLFCETTYTTATVSDVNATPAYVQGRQTGAVLTTGLGTVAGVVDPSWRGIAGRGKNPTWWASATTKDGLFLFRGKAITSDLAALEVGPVDASVDDVDAWLPLPRAAAPAASVVDRPTKPAPDRTSNRGRPLNDCLTAAVQITAVVDTESWAPGALLQDGGNRVIMARNEHGFASCSQVGGQTTFDGYRALRAAADNPNPAAIVTMDVPGGLAVAGTVHHDCVRMQVMLPSGTVEADVDNATFAVLIPSSDLGLGKPKTYNVKLLSADNVPIYEGPLG
jgi:hypothetical protein